MHRRLFASVLIALALAGGSHLASAAVPHFLVCQLPEGVVPGDRLELFVESFEGVGRAAQHCVQFWGGHPHGVVN